MADTQIDELRLDITVEDNTSGESSDKKVKNLATAISRLNKVLGAFDNAKFSKTFENMAKGIEPFVKKIDSVSSALENLATIVKKSGLEKAVEQATSGLSATETGKGEINLQRKDQPKSSGGQAQSIDSSSQKIKDKIKAFTDKLKEAQSETDKFFNRFTDKGEKTKLKIAELKESLSAFKTELVSQKGDYTQTLMGGGDVSGLKKQARETAKEISKVQKQINKLEGSAKKTKTPLSNLVKSFGRIAMYRAVRRAIQEITQAFTESIDGIAQYNSEFRDTMGSLQSSIDKAKASVGVAFYQTLIVLEPLITSMANGLVTLANSISKVTAQLRGASQYTKINTEYMKEYTSAVQGALAPFDTFTTLSANQGIDYSKMLETVDTPLDKENWTDLDTTISGVISALEGVWKILKTIIDGLGKVINWLSDKNLLTPAVYAFLGVLLAIKSPFALLITGIATLIGSWDEMSTTAKVLIPIISALAAVFTGLAVAKAAAAAGVAAPAMAGITAAAIAAGIALTAGSIIALKAYKDGGMMTNASGQFTGAGTMYAIAGENGAEIVAQGSQGTGVANVEQIADAVYRGNMKSYYDYGIAQNGGINAYIGDINALGTAIARSTGFKNETKRQGQRQYFN